MKYIKIIFLTLIFSCNIVLATSNKTNSKYYNIENYKNKVSKLIKNIEIGIEKINIENSHTKTIDEVSKQSYDTLESIYQLAKLYKESWRYHSDQKNEHQFKLELSIFEETNSKLVEKANIFYFVNPLNIKPIIEAFVNIKTIENKEYLRKKYPKVKDESMVLFSLNEEYELDDLNFLKELFDFVYCYDCSKDKCYGSQQ